MSYQKKKERNKSGGYSKHSIWEYDEYLESKELGFPKVFLYLPVTLL